MTDKPVKGAQNIIKRSVDELGEPTQVLNDGMLWITDNTLIYAIAYLSRVKIGAIPEYKIAARGIRIPFIAASRSCRTY